jgi:hypothetical protein
MKKIGFLFVLLSLCMFQFGCGGGEQPAPPVETPPVEGSGEEGAPDAGGAEDAAAEGSGEAGETP